MALRRRTLTMAHATKTSESPLRAIVLVVALAALLFPVAASADTMVTLQEGMLTLHVSFGTSTDSQLTAIGPDFALNAASGPFGFTGPHCDPCLPGSSFGIGTSIVGATIGSLTFAGVSYSVSDAPVPGVAIVNWTAGGAGIVMPPIGTTFTAAEPFSISIQARLPVCSRGVQQRYRYRRRCRHLYFRAGSRFPWHALVAVERERERDLCDRDPRTRHVALGADGHRPGVAGA